MKLTRYRTQSGKPAIGTVRGDTLVPLGPPNESPSLTSILESDDPRARIAALAREEQAIPLDSVERLPPIEEQEVWAAGVTYKRSRAARIEESGDARSFYDRVYSAERPELFMKSTPHRVAGHLQPVRIRTDATWNVPEPELTLVLDSGLRLVGFTVGNDMSSRDIEGENPLYLPQAKIYNQSAAIGPWITLAADMPPPAEIGIGMRIQRAGADVFEGKTGLDQMARSFEELIAWLGRENSFPNGVLLMTGTGIVPGPEFTLRPGDVVEITIDGIGTLSNPVVQG